MTPRSACMQPPAPCLDCCCVWVLLTRFVCVPSRGERIPQRCSSSSDCSVFQQRLHGGVAIGAARRRAERRSGVGRRVEESGPPVPPHSPGKPALCYMFLLVLCTPPVSADSSWCDVQQEYRSRKLVRLQKRIQEQLRSAAQPSSESAFGVSRPASDLMDVLQSFRASAPTEHVLKKGTHFTHTQKFTFTQVGTCA